MVTSLPVRSMDFTMNKSDIFIRSLAEGLARDKAWVLNAFSVKGTEAFSYRHGESSIVGDGKTITMTFGEDSYKADWWKPNNVIFDYSEKLTLVKDSVVNWKEKVETSYGRALINQIIVVENIGGKLDYIEGNWFKDGVIHTVLDFVAKDDGVTAQEAHDVCNSLHYLTGFTQLCVPSASEKALGTDPNIKKRLRELLKAHEGDLDNPTTISKIEQELIGMDKEWLKGDTIEGFYKSGKSFNVNRKRMHIMHGGEADFTDPTKMKLIPTSLDDGWDMDYQPELANATRTGTHGRGIATALGGEKVKKFQQVFQNSGVEGRDCKTKKIVKFNITPYNHKRFVGRYMPKGEKFVVMTEAMLKGYIGKQLPLRSPMGCKGDKTSYCEVCSGDSVARSPKAVNMLAATIGSVFMLVEMKKAHGTELVTENYNPFDHLH